MTPQKSTDTAARPPAPRTESGRFEPAPSRDEREEGDIEPRSTEAPKTTVPRIERYKER